MGVIYVSARKEVKYEEYIELKKKILELFKELGFVVEGDTEREVYVRYEE